MEFTLENVIALINGVGFPIAMCVALFWFNQFTLRAQQQALTELKESINNNTNATNALAQSIGRKWHGLWLQGEARERQTA